MTAVLEPAVSAHACSAACRTFPLSDNQRSIWLRHRVDPDTVANNVTTTFRILAPVDPERLRRALQRIVDGHPALRTTFSEADGRPVQTVHERSSVCFACESARGWNEETLQQRLRAELLVPFDLEAGPLARFRLFSESAESHVLVLSLHHAVTDMWTGALLVQELMRWYAGDTDGEPDVARRPPFDPAAYVRQQAEALDGREGERLRSYWHAQLAGELAPLDLPTDRPRRPRTSSLGAAESLVLDTGLTVALQQLAQAVDTTLPTVLLAAFQVLLYRQTGREDICVGTAKANRTARTARVMGYFVNPVVLRTDLSGSPGFDVLLRRTHATLRGAAEHDNYPFQRLVDELRPARGATAPFFQVAFSWQKTGRMMEAAFASAVTIGHGGQAGTSHGMRLESLARDARVVPWELSLVAAEVGGRIAVTFEYQSDLFDAATVARMAGQLQTLLAAVVADPSRPIDELPLLTEAERRALETEWAAAAVPFEREACVHALFERQASAGPDRVAVRFGDEALRYAELDARANRLARHLLALGVRRGDLVGIHLERSLEMVVAVLAVLKAGAGYVPLDPAFPHERLAYMLADSHARVLLTQESLLSGDGFPGVEAVCVDRDAATIAAHDTARPAQDAGAGDLAYVIYTSGSTGRPKGVAVEHRSVVNFLGAAAKRPGLRPDDVVLAVLSLSFDPSVGDLFLPLVTGAQVVIVDRETAVSSKLLQEAIARCAATYVVATATTWRMLVENGWPGNPLLTLVCGGEALPRELAERLLERCGTLWNAYGPTETTVWSSLYRVEHGEGPVPIGTPVDNTRLYVLDGRLQPQPLGVPGELYIGGDGLARGYLDRPELSAERFVPDPFRSATGARMYRTGDLARRRTDGNLEFLGRSDTQVKVRGYRIEPGEIEAALAHHPSVREAIVVVREFGPGDNRLVAYFIPADGHPGVPAELRAFLATALPDYMVPAAFVPLDAFPLTPNRKVDRKALPRPSDASLARTKAHRPAQNATQQRLLDIWREVLGVELVGIDDDFFDLGGHSLLATQIVSRIRARLHAELPVRSVFEAPTVAQLSELISAPHAGVTRARAGVGVVARRERLPLSHSQQRMWFLNQLDPAGAAYNMAGAVRLQGPLDAPTLEWALGRVVARHESLRTFFTAVDGVPGQTIVPSYEPRIAVVDYRSLAPEERQHRLERALHEDARRPFQLERLPLFHLVLHRLRDEEHVLFLNMHHIVSDQWSFGVLSAELSAFYRARRAGRQAELPPVPVQDVDYAAWHREWLEAGALATQLEYWRHRLDGLPVLDLPADRPRPAVQTENGALIVAAIPVEIEQGLQRLGPELRASAFMILLAAFDVLLSRYTGAQDVVVGTPIANRHFLESEGLISTLVNTLALRTDLSGAPSFRQLVERVQEAALAAYAHQDVPFARLVEELQPRRDTSRSPLFQAFFNVQNAPFALPDLGELSAEMLAIDRGAAQFDVSLSIDPSVTRRAVLEYNTDLFDRVRMERMLDHYWSLLGAGLADPSRPIDELPLLCETERRALETEWAAAAVPFEREACVHELFERQVSAGPDRVAVRFGGEALRYAELDARANRLARHLLLLGVRRGDLVAIHLERSQQMVVAMLAALKAGAGYVPLDPAFPRDRLEYMLGDSGARVIVTQESLLAQGGFPGTTPVCVDRDAAAIAAHDPSRPAQGARADDRAYVIYTSGSTGRPKGVQLEHRSVVNFLASMGRRPGLRAEDVVLSVTTLSFDIAVLEILLPLVTGAQVVVVDRETAVSATLLREAIARSGATLVQATPSTWRMLIEDGWKGDPRLTLVCGGEALPRELAQSLLERCGALWNAYGPTETTVWSAIYRVERGEGPVPIGTPVDNTMLYVLDPRLAPLPVGVPGELYIGGDGLARGYLDRPELNAERFLPDPFRCVTGARMYRTGDLARRRADGNLEFLGRSDTQVKVRGYRIELEEIEAALARHPSVRDAVVTAHEFGAGDTRLVAYLVPEDPGHAIDAAQLRAALHDTLPDYMVPVAFVSLTAFPLTPNKKVDRKALPKPSDVSLGRRATGEPPLPGVEEQLAAIWERVLGVQGIGRDEDFFDVGGHSLLAVRVFAQIEQLTGQQLPLTALFRAPTIAQLAELLRARGWRPRWTSLVAVQPEGSRPPFFLVAPFLITALSFARLARHLGPDQPLYALQPQGMDGDGPIQRRVEEMAAHYIRELRQVQPRGPYALGGHCAGNWVAFEMAAQLQAQGEALSLLVLVDSEPPNVEPPRVRRLRHLASRVAFYWKRGRLYDALRWTLGVWWERTLQSRVGATERRRVAELRRVHAEAHRSYRAAGLVHGDALLVRSEESAQLRDKDWHLRWAELITGDLRVESVPGTHAGLVEDASSEAIARKIRQAMDRVTGAGTPSPSSPDL